jgi:hypothetical protein
VIAERPNEEFTAKLLSEGSAFDPGIFDLAVVNAKTEITRGASDNDRREA